MSRWTGRCRLFRIRHRPSHRETAKSRRRPASRSDALFVLTRAMVIVDKVFAACFWVLFVAPCCYLIAAVLAFSCGDSSVCDCRDFKNRESDVLLRGSIFVILWRQALNSDIALSAYAQLLHCAYISTEQESIFLRRIPGSPRSTAERLVIRSSSLGLGLGDAISLLRARCDSGASAIWLAAALWDVFGRKLFVKI